MSPEAAIAALDRALAATGEDIVLRRTTGTKPAIPLDVGVRASVRGYRPEELVGGIIQGDSLVIVSPTEMKQRRWCWPPRANDKAVIDEKVRNVVAVNGIKMKGVLVRIELTVRG
jgi:hypothetical protein